MNLSNPLDVGRRVAILPDMKTNEQTATLAPLFDGADLNVFRNALEAVTKTFTEAHQDIIDEAKERVAGMVQDDIASQFGVTIERERDGEDTSWSVLFEFPDHESWTDWAKVRFVEMLGWDASSFSKEYGGQPFQHTTTGRRSVFIRGGLDI